MMRFNLSLILISAALFLACCAGKEIVQVKKMKYYSDDNVHLEVLAKTGKTHKIICAFPPNTDYERLKKIQIENVKSNYLLEGALYDCQAL